MSFFPSLKAFFYSTTKFAIFINRPKNQNCMMRVGTSRRKTRGKMKKHFRKRGKVSLSEYFKPLNPGDKVILGVEPAVHSGLYHGRFMGRGGTVIRKTGRCVEVRIQDGGKEKTLLIHPVHLRKIP